MHIGLFHLKNLTPLWVTINGVRGGGGGNVFYIFSRWTVQYALHHSYIGPSALLVECMRFVLLLSF